MNKQITVYTDGGSRNTGNAKGEHVKSTDLAAWAFRIIKPNGTRVDRTNCIPGSTNNQMEMKAVIEALNFLTNGGLTTLKAPKVVIITDSQYIHNSITKGWIKKWQKKHFKGVKNADEWKQLLALICCIKQIEFKWVKGHNGNPGNEFVDHLLNYCMDRYAKAQKQNKDKETSKE